MSDTTIEIGSRAIGGDAPVFIIAEIGINHNGDLDVAKQLMLQSAAAGCDAVKFQKRTPELCVPPEQRSVERDTPWGRMTYLDYRHRVEFGADDYTEIDRYAKELGIEWFASPWDEVSVDFLEQFDVPCYKVASASLTDQVLLKRLADTGRPVILSSGMSTLDEIDTGIAALEAVPTALAHATSTYPCPPEELNLAAIPMLAERYPMPIGYSGHEVGLQTTLAAVALGATFVERHVTLDRAMWGSDQAASIEPPGVQRLVRDIRVIERAIGDGVKRVYASEEPIRAKLRRAR